ncbi:MAG: ComF family protein [Defluviitaleaceae bacterium]|nr:ComF family protein [Defluviitaleaceae bacterium]
MELIYPARCCLCNDVRAYVSKERICNACRVDLGTLAAPRCDMLPTVYSALSRVYAAYEYKGNIRDLVWRFKFEGVKEIADGMAELIKIAAWPPSFVRDVGEADYFIPIPLHKSRMKDRGFNQSEVLADKLAEIYGITCMDALSRVKKTTPMYGLTRTERLENVRGVFDVNEKYVGLLKSKTVVLIDDIYTTGVTAEECAHTLVRHGVNRVYLLAFSIVTEMGGNT